MSTETLTTQPIDTQAPTPHPGPEGTRDLHVKGVPQSIWCRARCNATLSGMSYKEYIIRLLGESQPIPSQAHPPAPNRQDPQGKIAHGS